MTPTIPAAYMALVLASTAPGLTAQAQVRWELSDYSTATYRRTVKSTEKVLDTADAKAASVPAPEPRPVATENLLQNGSFEQLAGTKPKLAEPCLRRQCRLFTTMGTQRTQKDASMSLRQMVSYFSPRS